MRIRSSKRRTDNTMAERYQRGNENPYIEEKKNRQHNGQKIPKG